MKTTDWLFVLVLAGAVGSSSTLLPTPTLWWTMSGAAFLTLIWQAWRRQQQRHTIVELGGLRWNRHDFCENWLSTGSTGSGKTRSGILQLLHQLFKRLARFGLLCIDDKGVLFETLLAMTKHYGRDQDMILLQVRPTNAPPDWKPVHRFNLIGDRSIPAATYAAIIVAAAVVLGNRHEQSFFRRAAQIIIALGIMLLEALRYDVTLENLHTLLTNLADLQKTIAELRENPATAELARQLQDFLDQPPEQRAGILGTVDNYLRHFTSPEVAEVFSRDSTFSLADLDQGKVICLALPHRLQTERRYIGTFLKQLSHVHVLRRFDLPQAEREKLNLLVMLADEAQHFVTASDEGLSDHSLVDVVRESGAAVIAATQSTTSLIPPLGADQAKVLTLSRIGGVRTPRRLELPRERPASPGSGRPSARSVGRPKFKARWNWRGALVVAPAEGRPWSKWRWNREARSWSRQRKRVRRPRRVGVHKERTAVPGSAIAPALALEGPPGADAMLYGRGRTTTIFGSAVRTVPWASVASTEKT